MLHAVGIASLVPAVAMSLVADLRKDSGTADGWHKIIALNSHVEIHTTRIDRVVAVGPLTLRPLLVEMRRPDVSLDTFVRCYSACDQILAGGVRWHGGHIDFDKNWRATRIARIDGFSAAFRHEQIAEIIAVAKARGCHSLADR
jgi:hypothetical protein